jgi:hypothetical protein
MVRLKRSLPKISLRPYRWQEARKNHVKNKIHRKKQLQRKKIQKIGLNSHLKKMPTRSRFT